MISLKNVSTFMSAHVTPLTSLFRNTDRHSEIISPAITKHSFISIYLMHNYKIHWAKKINKNIQLYIHH